MVDPINQKISDKIPPYYETAILHFALNSSFQHTISPSFSGPYLRLPSPNPPLTSTKKLMTTTEKLHRLGSGESSVETEYYASSSKKLPSSQYKGVVPQPNGRWGAQIYQKHLRVWLGTFNLEPDAARAYDVAAQRFRGRDAVTNFKPLSESSESDVPELEFLDLHSKSEIVDMLRKHTYCDELLQNKRKALKNKNSCSVKHVNSFFTGLVRRELLFEKTVTPSDVGKLNRLVIPKHHAEKHLQYDHDGGSNGILMNFVDGSGKVWRFRYSYWNSSQSYVLTKGWSRFVKEKSLQAGDVVSFEKIFNIGEEEDEDPNEKRLFIDCKQRIKKQQQQQEQDNVVRLFGVNINSSTVDDCWINSNGKRSGRGS